MRLLRLVNKKLLPAIISFFLSFAPMQAGDIWAETKPCETLFAGAVKAFERGDWDGAQQKLDQALSIDPTAIEGGSFAYLNSTRPLPYYPGLYLGLTLCAHALRPPERGSWLGLFGKRVCQCADEERRGDRIGFRAAVERWQKLGIVNVSNYRRGCDATLECQEECKQLVDAYESFVKTGKLAEIGSTATGGAKTGLLQETVPEEQWLTACSPANSCTAVRSSTCQDN